jgi:hypothetical protein
VKSAGEFGEQLRERHIESIRKTSDVHQRQISLAAFDATEIRHVDADAMGQFLLREPALFS